MGTGELRMIHSHLLHFLGGARGDDGIADIGIDLGEEIAADDHRLGFGMIDVGRDDGAAARDFLTNEFRRHLIGDIRAEGFAVGQSRAAEIFADRDIFHLLGDDSGARIFELCDALSGFGAQRLQAAAVKLRNREKLAGPQAVVFGAAVAAGIFLDIAARDDPIAAHRGEALLDVDRDVTIRIRTGRVIEPDRRLATRQRHFAERHAGKIDLPRSGKTPSRNLVVGRCGIADGFVHGGPSFRITLSRKVRRRLSLAVPPSAGANRIRFKGTRGYHPISVRPCLRKGGRPWDCDDLAPGKTEVKEYQRWP